MNTVNYYIVFQKLTFSRAWTKIPFHSCALKFSGRLGGNIPDVYN